MHPNASGHTGYFKPWFGAIILLFYYSFWRRGYPRPPWRPLGPPCAPMTPALFHNLKGTQILYTLTYLDIRGAIKKLFFFTFSKKTETPPPPPFLTTSVFSDKDFLDWPRPPGGHPPPFRRKMVKKLPVFLYIKPPFLANYAKKSDKTLLDWVRPPPLVKKNLSIF